MAGLQELLDEIALEGLEGTTLENLFQLLQIRQRLALISEDIKERIWELLKLFPKKLSFYELNEARPTFKYYDRFQNIDEDYGVPFIPDTCPFQRFKYVLVEQPNERGSCEEYHERKPVSFEELTDLQYENVQQRWGNRLVVVACQELRESAIIDLNAGNPEELSGLHYCFLEFIARARYNGETTSGPWSILQFSKQDSRLVFHMKKILLQANLILEKTIAEVRGDRVQVNSILILPRFFSEQPNLLCNVMEASFDLLKSAPDYQMKLFDVRQHFPFIKKLKSLKKIISTSIYRKAFDVKTIPRAQYEQTNKSRRREYARPFAIITLRNPNKSISDIFSEELKRHSVKSEDDGDAEEFGLESKKCEEEEDTDVFDDDESYVDEPVKDQLLRLIERSGRNGIEPSLLCSKVGIHQVSFRTIFKFWVKQRIIHSYVATKGRNHTQMLVAAKYGKTIKKKHARLDDSENVKCAAEPNLPAMPLDEMLENVPNISCKIRPLIFPMGKIRCSKTERNKKRMEILIKEIDKKCILRFSTLRSLMTGAEKELGYTDVMCSKSLKRLVNTMSAHKLLNLYEIELRDREIMTTEAPKKTIRYLTHPKIDIGHEVLRYEVLKAKHAFHLGVEDRRIHAENRQRKQAVKTKRPRLLFSSKAPKTVQRNLMDKAAKAALKKAARYKDKSRSPLKTKAPKFLISRYLHEFLYYIVVELNEYLPSREVSRELLEEWRLVDSNVEVSQCMEDIQRDAAALDTSVGFSSKVASFGQTKILGQSLMAYSSDLNWRTFIPPLQTYADKPAGWVHLIDAVNRMPLSLFHKIFRFDLQSYPKIAEYLKHPIRQHYLLQQLPDEITMTVNRVELQRVYMTVLKLLNNMGLIQVNYTSNIKDQFQMWVYLNRQVVILDTTLTDCGYDQITPDLNYQELRFQLNSFVDLHQYWTDLQRICIVTKLGCYKDLDRTMLKVRSYRLREQSFLPSVSFDDAPTFDTGARPGDGLGAAGLSSYLYAHVLRNWSWPVRATKMPVAKSSASNKLSNAPLNARKRPSSKKKGVDRRLAQVAPRDDTDRAVLKNMTTIRANWSDAEDRVLKAARAVYEYIAAPLSTLQLISLAQISRDAIKEHLGIEDKTIKACLRRIQLLLKLNRNVPLVPQWLHILRKDSRINRKYGADFLQKLERAYPEQAAFEEALRTHFLIILAALLKIITRDELHFSQHGATILPHSIEEFHAKYHIRSENKEAPCEQHSNPRSIRDVQVFTVYGVLHSSILSVQDKNVYNLQAFEIYKRFSEDILEEAFGKGRTDSLVARVKRRNIDHASATVNLSGPGFLLSSKYRIRLQLLKIPYEIFGMYFESMNKVLQLFFSVTARGETQEPVLELRSPHSGYLYFLSDTMLRNMWDCSVVMPKKILVIDRSQIAGLSRAERILNKFHAFRNARDPEYCKELEVDVASRIKVRWPDEKHKIYYNVYDVLSKLPFRQLHFFCALSNLEKEVFLRPDQLFQKDKEHHTVILKCPFNCILRKGNYLDAIQKAVCEKKAKLSALKDAQDNPLVELTMKSALKLELDTFNIYSVVNVVMSFWRKKEERIDRKDLGRLPENLKPNYAMDWHGLCNEIVQHANNKGPDRVRLDDDSEDDDDDLDDDFETLLGKSALKAQDAIVVNLPTMLFRLKEPASANFECVLYNNVKAPRFLVEGHLKVNEVLRKVQSEALWKFTNDTIETLVRTLRDSGFSKKECDQLRDLHDYIQSHVLGATPRELLRLVPDEELLRRALQALMNHYMIKRVGVESFLYVHKDHINDWIVQTFHITRLEREALKKTRDKKDDARQESDALKRKWNPSDNEQASSARPKRARHDSGEIAAGELERQSTSNESTAALPQAVAIDSKAARHCLLMRPRPWIRLNASINRRVLDRWLGTILAECIASTGCTVSALHECFPNLFLADLQFLLELLIDLDCLHLVQMQPTKAISIFDKTPALMTEKRVYDFYNPVNTYVVAQVGAVSRMGAFIGFKKYSTEFV